MSRAPILLVAVLFMAMMPACGAAERGTVTVLISENPSEEAAFQSAVLAEFTRQTGIHARIHAVTRAVDQELEAELQTGTQPELAILPGPGELEAFAGQGVVSAR